MILTIDFTDETNEVSVQHTELVEKLLQHAASIENIEPETEVSVTFVTNGRFKILIVNTVARISQQMLFPLH